MSTLAVHIIAAAQCAEQLTLDLRAAHHAACLVDDRPIELLTRHALEDAVPMARRLAEMASFFKAA